jgi:hypothetical protein
MKTLSPLNLARGPCGFLSLPLAHRTRPTAAAALLSPQPAALPPFLFYWPALLAHSSRRPTLATARMPAAPLSV